MASLCALKRSDAELVYVGNNDDPYDLAFRLGYLQCFDVEIIAVFPARGALLPDVRRRLLGEVRASWFRDSIRDAFGAVIDAMLGGEELRLA